MKRICFRLYGLLQEINNKSPEEDHKVWNTCRALLYEIKTWSITFKFIPDLFILKYLLFSRWTNKNLYIYIYRICRWINSKSWYVIKSNQSTLLHIHFKFEDGRSFFWRKLLLAIITTVSQWNQKLVVNSQDKNPQEKRKMNFCYGR